MERCPVGMTPLVNKSPEQCGVGASRLLSTVVCENKKDVVNCCRQMKLIEIESVSKGDKMSLLQENCALSAYVLLNLRQSCFGR